MDPGLVIILTVASIAFAVAIGFGLVASSRPVGEARQDSKQRRGVRPSLALAALGIGPCLGAVLGFLYTRLAWVNPLDLAETWTQFLLLGVVAGFIGAGALGIAAGLSPEGTPVERGKPPWHDPDFS